MDNNFRLSLSMLVSRYTDQFEQCLTSIQPFFDAFPTEFIVVDTGAPKEAINLAKKYATQIVSFAWCDDFSKARNAGLRLCSGDWFLFLDDDEYFDDVTEIIDFLKSPDADNYTSLSYCVHDYLSYDKPAYCSGRVTRMVKRTDDLRFIHRIHECFDPEPLLHLEKRTSVFTHHYGYAAKTPQELHAHSRRNLPLLIEECRQSPGDYRLEVLLANEYALLNQPDQAHETLLPWVQKLLHHELPQMEYMHAWTLETYFEALFSIRSFHEMQDTALALLNAEDLGFVCKWVLAYYGGIASALLGQYPLAADTFRIFFLINDYMTEHPEDQWMENKYQYNPDYVGNQVDLANKFMCVISYNNQNYEQTRCFLSKVNFETEDAFGMNDTCKQIANFLATLP
ncbi:MAG: glycosyltransferase [Lachnospiraceae bacterium]|nr:glycosyltransferase [Lachnospiraceae bacterium]MDY3818800.1 glycosyltransferase [Lachnospiraceae bacterium]